MSIHNVKNEIRQASRLDTDWASADGAAITLAAVTGVDGTGSNAASKEDVDARLDTIETAINYLRARLVAINAAKGSA